MGPFKCPECGVWWAGLEHRCAAVQTATDVGNDLSLGSYTIRCTCPTWTPEQANRNYVGTCPIHDVHFTNLIADGTGSPQRGLRPTPFATMWDVP